MTDVTNVKTQMERAYADCKEGIDEEEGYKMRLLVWRATEPVQYDELHEYLPIIGKYNAFEPEKVIKGLEKFNRADDKYYLAREYSPCLYLKASYCWAQDLVELQDKCDASEVSITSNGLIRIWWD